MVLRTWAYTSGAFMSGFSLECVLLRPGGGFRCEERGFRGTTLFRPDAGKPRKYFFHDARAISVLSGTTKVESHVFGNNIAPIAAERVRMILFI